MAEEQKPVAEGERTAAEMAADMAKCTDFLHELGLVFRHSGVYGHDHSVTQKTLADTFSMLQGVLNEVGTLTFAFSESDLLMNGMPVKNATPAIQAFHDAVAGLEIGSFSLEPGISSEHFSALIELLHASPEEMQEAGGLAEVVQTLKLDHISATKVVFKQVTDEETVVSKKTLDEKLTSEDVEKLIAVLTGQGASEEEARMNLQAAVSDLGKVAEVIIDTSLKGAGDEEAVGKNLVDSVRQFYEEIAKDPKARTQKGKRELLKALDGLGDEIMGQLEKIASGDDAEIVARLKETVDGLKDDVRIDAIAIDYAKKQNAIESSEGKILRYMKRKGDAVFEDQAFLDKLKASGLSRDKWDDLLVKSGIAGDPDEADAAVAADSLVEALSKLGKRIDADGEKAKEVGELSPEDLNRMVSNVTLEVAKIATRTEDKILSLTAKIQKSNAARKGEGTISRKALLEFLAEIVQELRQPLSVMMSTIDAVKEGMLGEVTEPQTEMLALAADSAKRLDHLVSKLLDVSGLPAGLEPDAKILGAVYDS